MTFMFGLTTETPPDLALDRQCVEKVPPVLPVLVPLPHSKGGWLFRALQGSSGQIRESGGTS